MLMPPVLCRVCSAKGKRARVILALYAGPGGSRWLWTAGYRGLVNHPNVAHQELRAERIPPCAYPFEVGLVRIAVCQACRYGQPFLVHRGGIDLDYFGPTVPTYGRVVDG